MSLYIYHTTSILLSLLSFVFLLLVAVLLRSIDTESLIIALTVLLGTSLVQILFVGWAICTQSGTITKRYTEYAGESKWLCVITDLLLIGVNVFVVIVWSKKVDMPIATAGYILLGTGLFIAIAKLYISIRWVARIKKSESNECLLSEDEITGHDEQQYTEHPQIWNSGKHYVIADQTESDDGDTDSYAMQTISTDE